MKGYAPGEAATPPTTPMALSGVPDHHYCPSHPPGGSLHICPGGAHPTAEELPRPRRSLLKLRLRFPARVQGASFTRPLRLGGQGEMATPEGVSNPRELKPSRDTRSFVDLLLHNQLH